MYDFDEIRKRFPSAQGLSENQIVERLAQNSGVPYEQVAAQFGITKDTSSGFFGGTQDLVIEAANAAAGLVGSATEFVSPGNRFSRGIRENFIEPGEARQTVPTQLAKRNLARGLESSEFGPQARAVYDYVTENPLLTLAQAGGGFAPVGLPIRGVQAAATGLGLGTRGAARAGLATGSVISGAAAGGEAGGSAYELVMNTPREVLLAHPQAQALIEAGVTDEAAIYEELATRAARRASIVPAAFGAVAGAVGAESALVSPVRGARGVAKKTLTEFGTEGLEEGTTTYSGRAAAQEYNPAIDPMAGVAGSALLGGVMGAGIAAPIALARMERDPTAEKDLTQPDTAPAQEAPVGEEAPASPILTAARTLADFDPYAEIEARAAAGRPMSEAEATQFLSSTLAAQRAGQQFIDLMQQQQESAGRVGQVGEQYQRMVGRRGDQILRAQDAGDAARPIVAGLEQDLTAQEAPFIAAQQAGAGTQQLPGMVAGAGTVADYRRIMDPDVMQPVETQEFQPVERTALLPQQAAPFSNIRMDRPGPAPTPAPSSLLSERPADVEPVTPVGAPTAVAAALPAAQPAAGVSSTATTGAPSGTQAPQAVKAKTQRAKAPAAPAAAAVTEEATKPLANVSEAIKEDNEIDRVLKAVEAEDDAGADKLFAGVTGQAKKAPGRPSMPTQVYAAIRNAILNPKGAVMVRKAKSVEKDAALTEKYKDKIKRIAAAAKAFADAYETYSSTNLVRTGVDRPETIKRGQTADSVVATRAEELLARGRAVRSALAELGAAVDGNAKDVEAIVRFVKDRAQKEKRSNEKVVQNDILLSRAWAAAKRETFIGEPDLLDVSPAEVRQSRESEAKGATPQLVEAATDGYKTMGQGPQEKGLNGLLNYIRTVGTPFEKLLALAIKRATEGKAPIKIEFAKEGTSKYDPKTNTITINETSSKEVALHEALHGALQWFVYTNPNAAQVVALKAALQRVVNFDTTKLTPKAAEVQAILSSLMKESKAFAQQAKNAKTEAKKEEFEAKAAAKELDAVLELVSYGNTLNDFRRALQGMESNAPRTFVKFANDVMEAINALVRRMLGVKQSVASDVIENTIQLLESARQATQETAPKKGNLLKAEVTSYGKTPVVPGTTLPRTEADAITGQFQNPVSEAQLKKLSKTLLPEQVSSKFLFDTLGWASVPGKLEGASKKISDYVQKNHPGAATVASWVNSHFGLQAGVKDALVRAKDDRRGGSLIYNQIAQYFTDLPPQQSVAVLEYMDAKLANLRKQGAAPTFPINDPQMKDLADATITKWWEYARALRDPKQRNAYAGLEQSDGRWTGGVEFSQGLAFAESVDQLASPSFGVRNISKLISARTKDEVTEDAITFRTDANGSAELEDKFVGMFLLTPSLKKRLDNASTTAEASQILAELKPDEFISADLLTQDGKPRQNAEGVQLIPDRNYLWDLAEKDKGGFRFTARLDAKQALMTKKGRDLGHALQNTMAILANSYSANRLTEALASYEAGTPNATAFNTLDDLNAMLNGEYKGDKYELNKDEASWTTRIKQNQIVKLTDNEAKSETVKGLYRNRNQWVQLPNSPTYGALAGKIVNGSVWSAIEDMSDRRPLVNSAVYNGTMRWFKKAKTVYNPATWGTNVASNFTMAMMDDIPLPTLGYATKLYVGYMLPPAMAAKLGISLTREQQQLMLEIMKTNALLGDFSSSELKQSIYDSMRSTIGDKEQGVAERIMQFAKMEKDRIEAIKKYAGKGSDAAERTDQLLGDWYAMQDNVFRVASMLNNLGQQAQAGKTIDAEAYRLAGDHARFAFLDYDIDSKAVRIMRQTAFPFISWPYAAAKMIGNVAVHKPWKLVNLYAGLWILDGLTQAITGDDDDELRESGPEWARSRMLFGLGPHTHIRVPFMGDSENPVYYDIGKYITPSAFGDRVPNPFLGLSWWPSFVSPGGPYISSALALVGGVDPFSGKPLSPPTDSDWEKLSDRLVYTQSLFAPNLPFLNARELEKAKAAFEATEGRSENYSSLYMARTAGMRFYDFNVQGSLDQQDRAAAAVEREYKTEIGKLKRKQERLENPDWDAFYEREEELMMRMEKRIAEIRGKETGEE
jgi:hypothetical protein